MATTNGGIVKSRTSAGRTTTGLVAIVLAIAVSIGFMLVPAVASAGPSYPTLNENAYVTNGTVRTIVTIGTTTYIGGDFTQVGPVGGPMQDRNRIAALNATGAATTWNPNADNTVYALAVSGSTVYAGGYFTHIGGAARNRIAALNATGAGAATSWNPDADSTVYALAVSGSTVYAGGDFGNIGGEARNYIAALDDTTGAAITTWDPDADWDVYALAVSDTTVYAGGDFGNIGGADRNRIAALDATTGAAITAWDPDADDTVQALAVSDTALYAGGDFLSIGGEEDRSYFAQFDFPVPTITSVDPSSGPPGTQVTITGDNFGDTRGAGKGKNGKGASYVSFNGVAATEYESWSNTEIVCTVPEGATTGPVVVVTDAGTSNADHIFTVSYPTWYLAEGTCAWGFSTYITVMNPNSSAVTVKITYMDPHAYSGGKSGKGRVLPPRQITLPAQSQTTFNPRDDLGYSTDFSTKVECVEGKTIAVDRTMTWTGPGAPSPEAHNSIGTTSPSITWYLPEGSTNWGFETWTLVQNPNATEASVKLTYMTEDAGAKVLAKKIPAYSRATYNMASDIGQHDSSIQVTSDVPVVAERAMYRNNRREGACSIGAAAPAADYYLAEGTTDYGFTTYVLVQNPNGAAASVTVTYMTNSGPQPQAPFSMPANSRKTILVNDVLPSEDLSTQVHADVPIIAERAMYWGADEPLAPDEPPGEGTSLGEACHDSIGMASAHTTFYLPDGQTSEGRETWTLVQNPNDSDVQVVITYMTPNGQGNVVKTENIPASSRQTFGMLEHSGINGRAAIMVTCKTEGQKIMVERVMYWNNRGAGTDTIGGYSD